jgi:LacI family transcriptional regulator
LNKSRRSSHVTIKDIARVSGVSYSTVSRVLNNKDHVKPEKREQVLAAVARLQYVVNPQARSLAGGRSNVIGLLVPELGNGYIGEVVRGIDDGLSSSGYDMMLYTTHRHADKEATYLKTLVRGLTDGLLLLVPSDPRGYLDTLRQEQFPYVVIDHQGFDDFSPTVIAKNYQAALSATTYLIDLGHRRIGFIMGQRHLNSANERFKGYRDALQAHGIAFEPELVVDGEFLQSVSYAAADQLLARADRPTAIFASNDLCAFGAMDAARNRGLSIPNDISILGFDDIPQAASVRPALTTVRQPLMEMGRIATRMLLDYIANPQLPRERIFLETELVIRDSCAPLQP